MRAEPYHISGSPMKIDRHDKPVFIALDVEYNPAVADYARMAIHRFQLVEATEIIFQELPVPH